MPETPPAWYLRSGERDGDFEAVRCFLDGPFGDGETVKEPANLADYRMLWSAVPLGSGRLRVHLAPFAAPEAPATWFVNVDEPRASPRATNLVAFASDHFAPGTVINGYTFATLGISSDDQIGALRWYPETGIVHQVFVGEKWRRQQVGTLLIYAASAFHQARGWAGRLHSDGRRTDLGQFFVAGLRHPERIAPLSETMPPMDVA
jgi:GNAT superfamily N-acetyltransferase